MIRRLFIVALLALSTAVQAQELNCTVTLNTEQIAGSSKQMFQTLQNAISEFLNQTRWTPMTFATQEKIECSMLIVASEVRTDGLYHCEMTLQSRRPVYGSSYSTPVLNFKDKNFNFYYNEFDPLDYHEPTQLTSNLVAMLAYYAYLVIGYDCDSYEKLGGTPYFQVCEAIVNAAQSTSFEGSEILGWKAFDSNRNRYALINNLLDEAFRNYREYFYTYHRLGLDEMAQNVANARARIAGGITILRDANRARPATYAVNVFLDAKADELTQIFAKGTADEKKKVYEVLFDIDPTREELYSKITQK